ncbi:hypothetical protein ANN_10413 [Periplaneta americana]|uniref:Uncharacterized protein n=1 Tax=Periplaneta americana TaxID=6978 RepID=A0ABQ8TRR5_PERAM|nr:hypothetical protein ANN_10413 [Periplaneta americana]
MADLCEDVNEPPCSLKVISSPRIHCLAKDGSSRRVDIIAIDRRNDRAIIIDPNLRFETAVEQSVTVHEGKKTIYDPTIQYFRDYHHIKGQIEFTVLLSQSLEFTVSRTTDLQRQFTVLELGSLQLRSTALELRSLQLRSTALELKPSDADADADAHSIRTPAHKSGLLALAYSLTE